MGGAAMGLHVFFVICKTVVTNATTPAVTNILNRHIDPIDGSEWHSSGRAQAQERRQDFHYPASPRRQQVQGTDRQAPHQESFAGQHLALFASLNKKSRSPQGAALLNPRGLNQSNCVSYWEHPPQSTPEPD